MCTSSVPSAVHLVGTLSATVTLVIGTWLPWIQKGPIGYEDGPPYYTAEGVLGLSHGVQVLDVVLILLSRTAIAALLLARYREWSARGVVIGAGTLILLTAGGRLTLDRGRYVVEPGLYLVVSSGLRNGIIGVRMPGRRIPSAQVLDCSSHR